MDIFMWNKFLYMYYEVFYIIWSSPKGLWDISELNLTLSFASGQWSGVVLFRHAQSALGKMWKQDEKPVQGDNDSAVPWTTHQSNRQ
jgi:hypothetical protein